MNTLNRVQMSQNRMRAWGSRQTRAVAIANHREAGYLMTILWDEG